MKTREELLREKEEIEKQLRELQIKEYAKKIVILFNPDLTEGKIPFYSKKEFYIKEGKAWYCQAENFKKLIEIICTRKYGLYDGVMGTLSLMDCFFAKIKDVNMEDEDLPIFNISELSTNLKDALQQIDKFLETVPTKSNTRF